MKNRGARTVAATAVGLAALALGPAPGAQAPAPVRNDVPRLGQQEVVMMRHAYLEEGRYEAWHEASRSGVWPWFERLGARILGDFEVVYPAGDDATPGQDEALRFARYASYEQGAFEEYHAIARDRVWPYVEKIGVRPVGLWRVAYLPNSDPVESDDFDEVYYLARYAGYEHFLAVRDDAVGMGGNGPDFVAFRNASEQLDGLTQGRSVEFLRGEPYGSPPVYAPGLEENYRPVR